jgi:hypothetical protein
MFGFQRLGAMAAEPHVCDGIDLKWMYASDTEEEEDWSGSVLNLRTYTLLMLLFI